MGQPHKVLGRVTSRPKLANEIASIIRAAILDGEYKYDAKLGLKELADELGVSIMPVREALISLSGEGLVIAEPRRGFRAKPPTQEDLDDLVEIQGHFAGLLAARAALEATDADIAQLRNIHERFIQAANLPADEHRAELLEQLNSEFHRTLHHIPRGEQIRWLMRTTTRYARTDVFNTHPSMIEVALTDHPAIIDAIEGRQPELARTLNEAHFAHGKHFIEAAHDPTTV